MTTPQPDLPMFSVAPEDEKVAQLLAVLKNAGWMTRKQLMEFCAWDERTVRAVAEAAGERVVRGQKGINTVANASADELTECARQFLSQGRHMEKLGLAWLKAAHEKIG